jgi:hypothetical protein
MSLRVRVSLHLADPTDSSIVIRVTGDDADLAAAALATTIADSWRTALHSVDPDAFEPNRN